MFTKVIKVNIEKEIKIMAKGIEKDTRNYQGIEKGGAIALARLIVKEGFENIILNNEDAAQKLAEYLLIKDEGSIHLAGIEKHLQIAYDLISRSSSEEKFEFLKKMLHP